MGFAIVLTCFTPICYFLGILVWVGETDMVFNGNCSKVEEDSKPLQTCNGDVSLLIIMILVLMLPFTFANCMYACFLKGFKGKN